MAASVAERLAEVQDRIARAAKAAGRSPDDVHLLAVSKFQPVAAVAEAINAGQRFFGENRFQGTPEKIEAIRQQFPQLANELHWSFIGTLQSNKVKPILELFTSVQSIDRLKLLNRADRIAGELGVTAKVLLQVNVSGADTQGGVELTELEDLAVAASKLDHVSVNGLMAIGPLTDNRDTIRKAFAEVRAAAGRLTNLNLPHVSMDTLSMGMTDDYDIAIEEGSTMVRIGTAIFGPRQT
ncbi:YggS family pyridoxal phosphate-dependent enzyme [bacterium]|nr:YggS family pyridoxal phosphate-dependent enzyme [bacterium]